MGTLTTAKYQERVNVFTKTNEKVQSVAPLFPQQAYFGETPNPAKDPYDRRQVKQLNDISFEESEDSEGEADFEAVKSIKRLPQTVLTEENLKVYLTRETNKLDLEHAYWLKDTFLDKVGRMAPNLQELSLRRLKITNRAFIEIMTHLKRIEIIDVADCLNLQESGLELLIKNNKQTLRELQFSNLPLAVTDKILDHISGLESIRFLDISFAKQVTDGGLSHFHE